MSTLIRGMLEGTIRQFEPGKFQEFMIKYLHAYDDRYKSIVRFGATEFGKTRAGVPDMLQTLYDGNQIACECGTEIDYWLAPKNNSNYDNNWKPIKDSNKCLNRIANLQEVIIAANKPIPSNQVNTKTNIINHLESKNSNVAYVLISIEDIANWMEQNLDKTSVQSILKDFCPELYEYLAAQVERNDLRNIFQISSQLSINPTLIQKSVDRHPELDLSKSEEAKEIIISDYLDSNSIYQIETSYNPDKNVSRIQSLGQGFTNIFGKIIQIVGIPKIGKSTLAMELVKSTNAEEIWFTPPLKNSSHQEFQDVISYKILSSYWPKELVTKVVFSGNFNLLSNSNLSNNTRVFVFDDAQLLSDDNLQFISQVINKVRSIAQKEQYAFLFLTNKKISKNIVFSIETAAPTWTKEQVKRLLALNNISTPEKEDEYLDNLLVHSGGHPLIAINLAKKYPTYEKLVISKFYKLGIEDEDLSNEAKQLLYTEILTKTDTANFVQRLSVLTGRAKEDICDILRLKVSPSIPMTSHNIIEEVGPSVIEGKIESGIQVNHLFKDISKTKISKLEQNEVYKQVANHLLTTENKTVDILSYLDGIMYCNLSGQHNQAISSALFLFHIIYNSKEKPPEEAMKHILDRLDVFGFMNLKLDDFGLFSYYSLLLVLGNKFMTRQDHKRACRMFERVDLGKLNEIEIPEEIDKNESGKNYIKFSTICQRLLTLHESSDPNQVLIDFLKLDFSQENMANLEDIIDTIPTLIAMLPVDKLKTIDLKKLTDPLYNKYKHLYFQLAIYLGSKLKEEPEFLLNFERDKDISLLQELFSKLALASCNLSNKNLKVAEEYLNKAFKIKDSVQEIAEIKSPELHQLAGDIYFGLKHYTNCIEQYESSTYALSGEEKNYYFTKSWNAYKCGFASNNPKSSIIFFNDAIEYFKSETSYSNEYSRCLGAMAVIYLENEEIDKSLEYCEQLALLYHEKGRKEAGPALRLLMSHIIYLRHIKLGEPLPANKLEYPKPDKMHFYTLGTIYPEAGGVVTFNMLFMLAQIYHKTDWEIHFLRKSIFSKHETILDNSILPMSTNSYFETIDLNEIDWKEYDKILEKLLEYQPSFESDHIGFYFHALFWKIGEFIKKIPEEDWVEKYEEKLDHVEELLRQKPRSESIRWRLYINQHRGLCSYVLKMPSNAAGYFIEALEQSMKDKIWNIASDCSHVLAFNLAEQLPSLEQAMKYQLTTIESSLKNNEKADYINNIGINMQRFWSKVTFNRLSTKDLDTKKYLMEPAQELKDLSIDEKIKGKVMINLIFKLNTKDPYFSEIQFKDIPEKIRAILE